MGNFYYSSRQLITGNQGFWTINENVLTLSFAGGDTKQVSIEDGSFAYVASESREWVDVDPSGVPHFMITYCSDKYIFEKWQ